MSTPLKARQQLIETISNLPDESLVELASFLDYLSYKTLKGKEKTSPQANFLSSIAGLGRSGQTDVSERDEEILNSEIDPIRGWTSKPSTSV